MTTRPYLAGESAVPVELGIPRPAKLPAEFLPLITAFADRAHVSPLMVREVLENVYRSGYADGRLSGMETAFEVAVESIAPKAVAQ